MGKKWTEEEEDLCKQLLEEGKNYEEIANILNKTYNQIKYKNYDKLHIYNNYINPNDIINNEYGYWKVLKYEGKFKGRHKYLCQCICGKQKIVVRDNLINNKSTNCGCIAKIAKSKNGKANKKYNTYDLSGEFGIGYTSKNEPFYFDLEDYDKIKNSCWHKHKDGYMRTCLGKVNGKNNYILMHDLLVEKEETDDEVDHINGKPYDNQKLNFRIVKHINNMKNLKMYNNNTSGYQGVHWSTIECKWKAYITANNKRIHLGTFSDKNQAIAIRKQAEEKYFGEYNRAKEFKNK